MVIKKKGVRAPVPNLVQDLALDVDPAVVVVVDLVLLLVKKRLARFMLVI